MWGGTPGTGHPKTQSAVVLFAVETVYVSKHTCLLQQHLRELLLPVSGSKGDASVMIGSARTTDHLWSPPELFRQLNLFHADSHSETDGRGAEKNVAHCDAVLTWLQPFEQTHICSSSNHPGGSFLSGSITLRLIPLPVL